MIKPEDIGAAPVINAVHELRQELSGDRCGGCANFDEIDGMCMERWFKVRAEDLACPAFIRSS